MLQKDCLQSRHTAGARSGPALARVVGHGPITGLKVVAPSLLEKKAQYTTGAKFGRDLEHRPTTGLKVVAPGLPEKKPHNSAESGGPWPACKIFSSVKQFFSNYHTTAIGTRPKSRHVDL